MNNSLLNLIGNTPLIEFNYKGVNLFLKLESFNPGGSVKDRLALAMITDAENKGLINRDTTIIEPTSGNTGIGLAMICAIKGYKLLLTMPESMTIERRKIIELYGAQYILTPAEKGMRGAVEKAEELARQIPNSFIPYQFKNKANVEFHYRTTGPEIWRQTNHQVDVIVAGVGTGGTITGVGRFIKERNPQVKIYAVEPYESPVLSGGQPSTHKIQGIGAGFIPDILDTSIYDEVITIKSDDAYKTSLELAQSGLLCGISSGANVLAAYKVAKEKNYVDKKIVTFICDTGERYLNNLITYKESQ